MSRTYAIRGTVESSSKILDCANVAACGIFRIITTLELFQHHFSQMGHRETSCDPHLHQTIEQPMLPTSREASAARAATSKRGYRRSEVLVRHMYGRATCQALSPGPRSRSRILISLDHR